MKRFHQNKIPRTQILSRIRQFICREAIQLKAKFALANLMRIKAKFALANLIKWKMVFTLARVFALDHRRLKHLQTRQVRPS
jgi:hypothetical protein